MFSHNKEQQIPDLSMRGGGDANHTKVRMQEWAAKGFIWFAAGFTLLMLALVVGYIILNGFYTKSITEKPYLDLIEETVALSETGEREMRIIANGNLRLPDITYSTLREFYAGEENYWGYITKQNRKSTVLVFGREGFAGAAARYLLGSEREFGEHVITVRSEEELLRQVRGNEGAIALVPAGWGTELGGVRTVGLRQASLTVNPQIAELQAGQRLETLTMEQVRGLLSGRIESWEEVGGPSVEITAADLSANEKGEYEPLEVIPVLFSTARPLQHRLLEKAFPRLEPAEGTVRVDSVAEFERMMENRKGAFGIIRSREAEWNELTRLKVERVTRKANLRPSFIYKKPSRAGAVGGISYIILNTLAMVAFVLAIVTPIGVAAALYLVEYSKQGKLLTVLRIGTDTLAGVPSIIFGLFGFVFFAQFLNLQTGLISGSLTLAIMILPTVIRTAEEALRSVPAELKQASMALGATKHQTSFYVIVPAAASGILTGVILGIGRAIGETAAILFTMGSNMALLQNLNSPIRVLSVHLYMLVRENISIPNAFATATILLLIVFTVNFVSRHCVRRMHQYS